MVGVIGGRVRVNAGLRVSGIPVIFDGIVGPSREKSRDIPRVRPRLRIMLGIMLGIMLRLMIRIRIRDRITSIDFQISSAPVE